MKLNFTLSAWEDYLWFQANDRRLLRRINLLIQDVLRSPFVGIGKPEPLKGEFSGCWSRRIDERHRLIYAVTASGVSIIACRYHYGE